MRCVFLLVLFTFTISISYGQFVPLFKHELLRVKSEIPLNINYQETLNDCPNKYYKYGGQSLISSLALDPNKHHMLSHFVLLGQHVSEKNNSNLLGEFNAKCVGLLISDNWTLVHGNCIRDHKDSLNTIKTGVSRYGLWEKNEGNLVEVFRIITNPSNTDFILVESKNINFETNVSPACLWTQNNCKIFESVNKIEIQSETFNLVDKTVLYDWRNDNSGLFSDGFVQKFLTLSTNIVPFVIYPQEKLTSDVVAWIEQTTNHSYHVKECSHRYIKTRLSEPFVSRFSYYRDNDYQEFVPLDALIQSSTRFYRAIIKWEAVSHTCTGALISDRHILTTAKCLSEIDSFPQKVTFQYNPHGILEHEETIHILNVTIHADYDPFHLYNNVALILLNDSVTMSANGIYPACIPEFEIEELKKPHRQTGLIGNNCPIFFSNQKCNKQASYPEKQHVVLIISNVTSLEKCQRIYDKIGVKLTGINHKTHFCSGNHENLVPGSCKTDIGGSIGRQIFTMGRYFNFLFGIINIGEECGCGIPSIVTRLSHYLPWLNKQMFRLEQNQTFLSESSDINVRLEKRDKPVEVSILMRSDINNDTACMGVLLDSFTILTVKNCSDHLRISIGTDINFTISTNDSFSKTIKNVLANQNLITITVQTQIPTTNEKPYSLNVWPKNDTIPFKLISENISLENTVTSVELFTLYPDMCQKVYNISLKYDEFCVEPKFIGNKIISVGSPVWQHFVSSDWTDKFGFFVGLVNKIWKKDDNWMGVVTKVDSKIL